MLFKSLVSSFALVTIMFSGAPASASLLGDAIVIKRIQGGNFVFSSVSTTVGAGIEFSDNFFMIDVTENEIVFDAISNFSVGDIVYTIEGLDFDDLPATPNVITAFSSTLITGSPANPFEARRATIGSDGKFSLSFNQVTGSGNGIVRVTLGAPVQAPVPEPAAWAMMIGGFAMAGAASRRRHKASLVHA